MQLQKYYQPRKSHRTVSVVLHGERVPLYGAGAGLALSSTGGEVPLALDFDIISRGYVIGKLVRVKHRKHITCLLVADSSKNKPIKFAQRSCTYTWVMFMMAQELAETSTLTVMETRGRKSVSSISIVVLSIRWSYLLVQENTIRRQHLVYVWL